MRRNRTTVQRMRTMAGMRTMERIKTTGKIRMTGRSTDGAYERISSLCVDKIQVAAQAPQTPSSSLTSTATIRAS